MIVKTKPIHNNIYDVYLQRQSLSVTPSKEKTFGFNQLFIFTHSGQSRTLPSAMVTVSNAVEDYDTSDGIYI